MIARPFAPYVDESPPGGLRLRRPMRRGEKPRLLILRMTAACFVGLAIALGFAATRLAGTDALIAAAFAACCMGGAIGFAAMALTDGVRSLTADGERLVVVRAGIGGLDRRRTIQRASVSGLRAEPVGAGRQARWRVLAVTADGAVELACLARRGDDRSPIDALARRLGVPVAR